MIKLISIEIAKLVRRKKFLIGVVLLFILSIFITFLGINFQKKNGNTESTINFQKNYIKTLKEECKINSGNGEYSDIDSAYKMIIEDSQKEIEHLENMIDENIPNKERLKMKIDYCKERKKRYNFSASMVEYYNGEILKSQYYINNNISYDFKEGINAVDQLIYNIIPKIGELGLLIIVAVMTADIVAGENKPATIKFMLVKPIKRWKIIFSKFIAAVLSINLIILVLELLMFIVIGLIYGFGDMSFPNIVGTTYESIPPYLIRELKELVIPIVGSSYLISNGMFLLQILILQFLVVTATIAFSFLFSTICNDSNTALILPIIFIVATQWINSIKSAPNKGNPVPPGVLNKILPFIFTSYPDESIIISGKINKLLGISFVNLNFSIIVLLGWISICYIISNIIFIKKDITT
ncbi:ABC transporter permease subunit [Clostridium senegalense]|uniref:ABC transporter permease subunit n=1 Tax=Clostridium senegalense TaxID=1465809 RepID=UPI000289E328|nr:ABC transporter permease subunit [Clostridium senegalense]